MSPSILLTMNEELTIMLQEYARQPVQYFVMQDPTVRYTQANHVCGDLATVHLRIVDNCITDASHSGEEQLHTSVAASILMEVLPGTAIDTVLWREYAYMQSLGFSVSPRRKRAAVTALLAVRNAIHDFKKDGIIDDFEDVL